MQVVTIEITTKCPMECPSCFIDKSKSRTTPLSKFKQVVKKLPSVDAITLTGGDPFTIKNLPEYCNVCPVKPTIFTSGYDADMIKNLEGKVKKIHIDLKYPNRLNDRWMSRKGAYDMAINFLRECKKHSIPTWINWVVDKTNLLYVREMLNFAVTYNSKILALPFIPYDSHYSDNRIPLKFFCNYFTKVKRYNPLLNIGIECDVCKAGITRMNINQKGDVSPCIYLPSPTFGNVYHDDIGDIINRMELWREEKGMCSCIAISKYSK